MKPEMLEESSIQTHVLCTIPNSTIAARDRFPQTPTHFHGKVHPHVNVLCPHIVGWLCVQDRKDATVQVGLSSCLSVTGDSEDGSAGPVPGD